MVAMVTKLFPGLPGQSNYIYGHPGNQTNFMVNLGNHGDTQLPLPLSHACSFDPILWKFVRFEVTPQSKNVHTLMN